ncbi:MAG: hypothetical protein ABJF01_09790 [bacterium]
MADDFSPQIAALIPGVPIVLLPVRIETRVFAAGNELRVRIYPDQIHADAHEPELTTAERDAGVAYWTAVFAAPDPRKRTTTPWADLSAVFGAPRAAWITRVLKPANFAQLGKTKTPTFPVTPMRTSDWAKAARAAALPKRWLVTGLNANPDGMDGANAIKFYEFFRKWSNEISPTLDLTVAPDFTGLVADGALPLQPTARWLTDFDEAERVGMAVRVLAADCKNGMAFDRGFSRLQVIGVDWTQTPDAGAATLRQLMYSHVYTDGLSAIDPGTPTNVTFAGRAGAPPTKDAWVASLNPETHPAAAAVSGNASDRLWRDLGIVPTADDLLTAYPGANSSDSVVTSHLVNALWEGTLGSFAADLLTPLVNDATLTDTRNHARQHLRPAGAYPVLRIGKQPYGVLPVVASRTNTPGDTPFEGKLNFWIGRLESMWRMAAASHAPRMGRSPNVDNDLVELLQRTPVSGTYQYRAAVDPVMAGNTSALSPFAATQTWTNNILWGYLGGQNLPLTRFVIHPASTKLGLALVDPTSPAPGALLSTNYFQAIANLARTDGSYDGLKARGTAGSVLEALATVATARELHRADMRIINNYRLSKQLIQQLPPIGVLHLDLPSFGGLPAPVQGTFVNVANPSQASRVVLPSVTGTRTVRQTVAAAVATGATVPPEHVVLSDMLASLEFLGHQPADQLERCLRSLLDGFSYRLDAWITSVASRRLATMRAAKPTGVYVGAYGFLDDLKPSPGGSSLGYIHTPSLAQATTTAVLRSGHLSHKDAEHNAFDINLSSERVQTALTIIDGVAQGQPLTALLGYRFERSVRSASLTLAKYILPFRRLVPLRPVANAPAPSATPSENISARDVVDGVALLDRWRNERATLLSQLDPKLLDADRAALSTVLDSLASTYDAVADVMVAEAVHQSVLGNRDRAGAVLAALDRQETAPRMEFINTRRTSKSFTHRALVLIGDESVPTPWSTIPLDARAKAEPRLNAWVARLIGDPARFSFGASVTGSSVTSLTAGLVELGLSPLSLVMASEAPGKDSPSELEERLAQLFASKVPSPTATTELALLDAAPAGSAPTAVGLGALRSLLRWIYALVTTQRTANANDLSLPQDGDDEGLDPIEIAARADAVSAAYTAAITTLDHLIASPPAVPATGDPFRDALWAAAAFGVRAAVPAAPTPGGSSADRDELVAQATATVAEMRSAKAREAALVTTFGAGAGAPSKLVVTHHADRMRALLDEHFPILPRFVARNAPALAASIGDRATLCAGDDLAPLSWLQRMALVRPGVGTLSRVLMGSEMLQTLVTPASVLVAQLPRAAGERWLALPFGGTTPEAELSIAVASSGAIDFSKPLAGFFCDAWSEAVPSRDETTGMTFHYDSPGARPPQAVLIAVPPLLPFQGFVMPPPAPQPPPPQNPPSWTVDLLLETIMEAHRLAPVRAVSPADLRWLGTTLPPLWMPSTGSMDFSPVHLDGPAAAAPPPNGPTPSAPAVNVANVLGKA